MELRVFKGCFVIDGWESDEVDLRVILSTGGGITAGSGSFSVPAALVGRIDVGSLTFRTDRGDSFSLLVREIDPAEGEAYFLTGASLPAGMEVAAQDRGVA